MMRRGGPVSLTAKRNDTARRVEDAAVVHGRCVSAFETVGNADAINLTEPRCGLMGGSREDADT